MHWWQWIGGIAFLVGLFGGVACAVLEGLFQLSSAPFTRKTYRAEMLGQGIVLGALSVYFGVAAAQLAQNALSGGPVAAWTWWYGWRFPLSDSLALTQAVMIGTAAVAAAWFSVRAFIRARNVLRR